MAAFEVTGWDQGEPYDAPGEGDGGGPPLARARVTKTFTGDLEGTSTAELLLCGQAGYLAHERVTGRLAGRSGTFVLQHGGIVVPDGEPVSFGAVVPGSGTGELVGLSGQARFGHDEAGAVFSLEFDLPIPER